ncbi:MAG: FTR1 family protein, partial [Acidobacteria bacterium]|nr:FTR1 family protein [Acidobacteriota bacterium]
MFEALIVTLREGVEAALVVGIILAYLKKTGRENLARFVFSGLGAGLAGSLLCAVVFVRLEISEEAYDVWLMLLGSLFVASIVFWMWRTAKGLKREIEQKVEAITSRSSGAVAAGLFLLTFLLILREGVETVLFLGAIKLTTDSLLAWFGGILGLCLAALFGIAFVRGTVRVD